MVCSDRFGYSTCQSSSGVAAIGQYLVWQPLNQAGLGNRIDAGDPEINCCKQTKFKCKGPLRVINVYLLFILYFILN